MAKKEDEDSGLWWKLGLAGAAVAAVGGLVYGAVKLADHVEEEKEKEKQREKSEKLGLLLNLIRFMFGIHNLEACIRCRGLVSNTLNIILSCPMIWND